MPRAVKVISRVLLYVALTLVGLVILLGLIGGGWGDKPPLPDPLAHAPRPLLFAHRGATVSYPENSLGAFGAAAHLGFGAIELDIQNSADSHFVVLHDHDTQRMTGFEHNSSTLTVAQLDTHPLLFNGQPSDQTIPALDSVVDQFRGKLIFYFDMKRYGHDSKIQLAHDIAAFIDRHDLYGSAIVASAFVPFITWLEYNYPKVVTAMEGIDPNDPWLYFWLPTKFRPDLISSRYATLSPHMLAWLRESGMNRRYITYHIEGNELDSALHNGLEMFIIDYSPALDSLLGQAP